MIDPIALTQQLIQAPSITPDNGCGIAVVRDALKSLGFSNYYLPFGIGEKQTHNLFAKIGSGGPHFCFAGHTDVVPVGGETAWTHPPFSAHIEDGKLFGRGAEDMKAAIAAFIAATSRILENGKPNGTISLLITGDEEGTGEHGTREMLEWLQAHGDIPDVCLVGEPTNPETIGDMAKIGRRGSMNTILTVHGKQGHIAYPDLADNPATHLVEMLHALKSHKLDDGTEFFPPSNLEISSIDIGNPAENVIPARASAKFNIRFNNLHQSTELKEWISKTCLEIHNNTILQFRVSGEAFLSPPGPLSDLVVNAVHTVTGHTPTLSTTGGTSDARFIKDICPVIEFGTTGRTPHQVNEWVYVKDIEKLTDVYETVLQSYFD